MPMGRGGESSPGVTDHGALTGLADDDHTQYLLLAGRSSVQEISKGVSVTVADTINHVAFEISQNDITNNPNSLNVNNLGTGNTLFVNTDGDAISINIDSEATNANTLQFDGQLTAGKYLQFSKNLTNLYSLHFDGRIESQLIADVSSGNAHSFSGATAGELTAASDSQSFFVISPNINQSGTAGYNALLVNVTETGTGSGTKNIVDFQVGSTSMWAQNNKGQVVSSLISDLTAAGDVAFTFTGATNGELAGTGAQTFFKLAPRINQANGSGGSYTIFAIDVTETSTDNTVPNLFDFKIGGVRKFRLFSAQENWTESTLFEVVAPSTGRPSVRFTNGSTVSAQIITDASGAASAATAMVFDIRSAVNNHIIFINQNLYNYSHGDRTDPWVYVHSRTGSNVATNEWIGIAHNTVDATIETGKGDLKIVPVSGKGVNVSGYINSTLQADISSGDVHTFSGAATGEMTASSGTQTFLKLQVHVNQSGSGAYNGFYVNAVETARGTGDSNLFLGTVAGVHKFSVGETAGFATHTIATISSGTADKAILALSETITDIPSLQAEIIGNFTDNHLGFGVRDGINNCIVVHDIDAAVAYGHTDRTDPCFYIHSRTGSGSATNEWIGFLHDITDGKIETGKGHLKLDPVSGSNVILPQGESASFARIGGSINYSVTQTGNSAGSETDLFSYSIPGSTLGTDGDTVEFYASGTIGSGVSADKRIRVYFGATTIFDTGALSLTSVEWRIEGQIIRTGSATQKATVSLSTSSGTLAAYADYSTPAETLSSAVVLRLTGAGSNASDVVGQLWKVIWMPTV